MRRTKTSNIFQSFQKIISSPAVIIVLFVVAGFLFARSIPMWRTKSIVTQRVQERERRYEELEKRNRELDELLKLISKDEGKRQILKQYYDLGEDGERIIFLTTNEKNHD